MVSNATKSLLVVVLGVLLVVNPLFVPTGHVTVHETLTATPANGSLFLRLQTGQHDVRMCSDFSTSRECLLERRVLRHPIPVGNATTAVSSRYAFVYFNGDFYQPTRRRENGTVVLSLERVTRGTVADGLAHPASGSAVAERAVSNGRTNVSYSLGTGQPAIAGAVVSANGTDYWLHETRSWQTFPLGSRQWFRGVEFAGLLVGLVLLAYGHRRIGR